MTYNAAVVLIVIIMLITSGCMQQEQPTNRESSDNILIHNNEADFKRIEAFISRFEEGKGDYILIISPTLEGGYWIYDLSIERKQVIIRIDTTRDAYSTGEIVKVVCKGISIETEHTKEEGTRRVLEAQHCDGDQAVEKFQVSVFD
ncbi:DUF4362 domain-containing protein [Paenibacillus mendelii]|nr:DUF4362 domain-containing protein [Paenibacillus mendelii]